MKTLLSQLPRVARATITLVEHPRFAKSTRITIQTTDESRQFGLYTATRDPSSDDTLVDWGDGSMAVYLDSLARSVHTYAQSGVFTITISDDIHQLAVRNKSASTVYATTYAPLIQTIRSNANKWSVIPATAFSGALQLQQLNLQNQELTSLNINVFANCPALKGSVKLPHVTNLIGTSAANAPFYGCAQIAEIHFAAANEAAIKSTTMWSVDPTLGAANAQILFDL